MLCVYRDLGDLASVNGGGWREGGRGAAPGAACCGVRLGRLLFGALVALAGWLKPGWVDVRVPIPGWPRGRP